MVFDWRLSRRHGELTSLVKGFRGVLQSDGYGAYPNHARHHEPVTRVACWAHATRYFVEAMEGNERAVQLVPGLIAQLYRLEAQWDAAAVVERRAAL